MQNKKTPLQYAMVTLKGMAMGAADVVPGVSGGTIAFITGIYEELITTIDKLSLSFFKYWKKEGFIPTFKRFNLGFLCCLFLGIFISVLSLAKLISYLLDAYPVMLWAFFFGLILASIWLIGKQIMKWNIGVYVMGILGIAISYYITVAEPLDGSASYGFIFISGFLAIIAMILPGISGAFILLLLGSYALVLGTVEDFVDGIAQGNYRQVAFALSKLIVFMIGCVIGLKSFSKALTYLYVNYKNLTLALLTGFMIGALNKVWPWKEVLSYRTNSEGHEVPLLEKSILPQNFDGDPQILSVVILAVFGFLLIFIIERLAIKKPLDVH
ncbi:MAG: DUF368 domain-containing protein [Cytophagaceae bacterium]|nr:DUF368 domain-containing protein [Cytophagaceae bacterium]|tara:strand:- start:3339 stop:4319 length:981 start_codon:yes stop_codon:yes gene_type:complete